MTSYNTNHEIISDHSGTIVVLAKTDSIDDICLYSSCRGGHGIFGKELYIVPYEPLMDESNLSHFVDWCNKTITQSNTVQLWSLSVSKDELIALKERVKPKLKGKLERVDLRYKNFSIPVYRCYAEQFQERVRIEGGYATFTPPKLSWLNDTDGCVFGVDISFQKSTDISKRFLPPIYPGLNRFLCNNSGCKSWFLPASESFFRITGEYLSRITDKYFDYTIVFLPDDEEIFECLLKFNKLETNITDKCRYTRRIIDLFGGLNESKILKSVNWRELFINIRKNPFNCNVIWKDIKPAKGTTTKDEKDKSFTQYNKQLLELARKNILLRGYKLICPSCGYTHWYSIEDIHEVMHCIGCMAKIQPPIDGVFAYQLNALVSRGIEQGVFPVILTILYLREICEAGFHYLPGVEVKDGEVTQDLDLIASCDRHLVVAECKSIEDCTMKTIEDVKVQLEKTAEMAFKIGAQICFLTTLLDEKDSKSSNILNGLISFIKGLNEKYGEKLAVHLLNINTLIFDNIINHKDKYPVHRITNYLSSKGHDWQVGKIRDEGNLQGWY
jgi:hypothetical protein